MKMKRYRTLGNAITGLVAILMVLLSSVGAAAASDNVVATAARADSAYNAGDFEKAVTLYKAALADGHAESSLYFNLGNAAYEAGDYGTAVVSYERARRLDPTNSRIKENLRFVNTKVTDANRAELHGKKGSVEPDVPSFLESMRLAVARNHASDGWAVLAAIAFVLFLGMGVLYVYAGSVALKKLGFFSGFVLLFFSVIFLIFSFMAAHDASRADRVVLTAYKTELLSSPEEGASASSSPLCRGTQMELVKTKEAPGGTSVWAFVRLNSDNSGWVPLSDIEII